MFKFNLKITAVSASSHELMYREVNSTPQLCVTKTSHRKFWEKVRLLSFFFLFLEASLVRRYQRHTSHVTVSTHRQVKDLQSGWRERRKSVFQNPKRCENLGHFSCLTHNNKRTLRGVRAAWEAGPERARMPTTMMIIRCQSREWQPHTEDFSCYILTDRPQITW